MKKILFAAVVAAGAMLASCGNVEKAQEETPFVTYNGVTSYSGTFYKAFDFNKTEKDSIVYDVKYDGENANVTIPVTFVRSEEVLPEGKELDKISISISGRDEAKDVEFRTDASAEELAKAKELLSKPAGEKVVITFTTTVPKADIDKIKGKKVWTSVLM